MIASPIMSKANQVKELLLSEIESGKYGEGDRLPSDNVLMRELQVSRNTVREALSFLTTEGHVIRIQGKGTYVTKKKPVEPSTQSQVIYVITRNDLGDKAANPFIGEILRGTLQAVEHDSLSVKLNTFEPNEWFISPEQVESICKEKPHGIIFAGFTATANIVKQFHQCGIPCCSIGLPAIGVEIPSVEVDHFSGLKNATNHLIQNGHKNIILLNATAHQASAKAREEGFQAALKAAKIPFKPNMIQSHKTFCYDIAKETIKKILEKQSKTSALLIYGDYATLAAIHELAKHGKNIPEDISIIMYSGFDWACKASGLDITRVEQSRYELGWHAAQLLLGDTSKINRQIMLKTTFIKGQTCRNIKTEAS